MSYAGNVCAAVGVRVRVGVRAKAGVTVELYTLLVALFYITVQ